MSKQQTFGRSRPSVSYELIFRKELEKLGQEMQKDVEQRLQAYLQSDMAQDAASVRWVQIMKALRQEWYRKYKQRGIELAKWLATKTDKRTAAQIQRKLKKFGFSITPQYTDAQKQLIDNIVAENVSMIQSIPQQYLRRVQRATAAAFKRGQDVGGLTKVLQVMLNRIGDDSKTRAALIARDQNQKATQAFAVANAQAFGARRGRWIHVPGKYSSRITHIKMDKQVFDLEKGIYDPDVKRLVKPGELIYCNCQFQILMPGFEE